MSGTPAPPSVSGIMAARNAAAYVGAAIESAMGQTYANFELLVVDDASTDETATIAAGYAERDARVRLFRQPERHGSAAARNVALAEARGEWIAPLDADDLWRPTRLERQMAVVKAHPAMCLIGADYERFDEEGRRLGRVGCELPEWWIRWRLLFGNALGGHSQILFHRETAMACGGYRRDNLLADDYQLWVALAEKGGITSVPEVLMDYRVHAASISMSQKQSQQDSALAIAGNAIQTLAQENWPAERLAALCGFWFEPFPPVACDRAQLSRDLRFLQDVFWRRYSDAATPANRFRLVFRTRRRWARYGRYLHRTGCGRGAAVAFRYAVAW
jgi:glycosyltransferase involved in cell wall biosynthesis